MKIAKVEDRLNQIDKLSHNGSAIGIGFEGGTPAVTKFTYPPKFLSEYNDRGLARHDATLHYGFQNDGIQQWEAIKQASQINEAFDLARSYGILDGVCFATTVFGRKTIASVSQDPLNPLSEEDCAAIYECLIAASLQVYESQFSKRYSQNTIEWLKLAVQGKDDKETAEEIGLTIYGARARRKAALLEIGAANAAQAVALAFKHNPAELYGFV